MVESVACRVLKQVMETIKTIRQYFGGSVDGWNQANQLRLIVYPIIYKVLYIPGG